MPKPNTERKPSGPISELRKLQLLRLERNHPQDYARVLGTLNPADKATVITHVAANKDKPLPPMPDPGKVKFGKPGPKT